MQLTARPRRWWKYLLIAAGVGLVGAVLIGVWYSTTDSFQAYVRRRLVAEVERLTGGRAEIGSFHIVPLHLQVEIRNITVHGKEGPDEVPLAHADSLLAQVKVVSFLRTEFGFTSLSLERPVIHVSIGPDGSTNIPALPVAPEPPSALPIEQLFTLSIDRLSVSRGELLWADQKIPLNFTVADANAEMDYSFLRGRYDGHLALGKVDTKLQDLRPFSWTTSIDFGLGPTFADIRSLEWHSGRSSLEASGRVSDFRNPRIDGSYQAQVNLGEAAAIRRRKDLRGGYAEFNGAGHWSFHGFMTSGSLSTRDLEWQDDQLAIRKAAVSTDYQLTDEQIKLSKLQGKVLGGSLTGEAEVDNWLYSVPMSVLSKGKREEMAVISAARPAGKKGERTKPPGVESGTVHLRLRDISVAEATTALSVPAHPLAGFRPAGVAGGSIDAAWKETPAHAEIGFALDVVPPARPQPGELPVTAHVQGTYRGAAGELELARFTLTTPASKIVAEGTLASSSKVHLSALTSNLDEWRPLVKALGGPAELPFQVKGNAAFSGVAGGTFSSPTLAGTLNAEDFEFIVPPTAHTPRTPVHWDSLAGTLEWSSQGLSLRGGTLRRGDTSADFEATASLQNGEFTDSSPFTGRVNLHNVDVAGTAALAKLDYPISGTADISLEISGTRARPQGRGHIRARNASAYGEAIEKLDAELQIGPGETTLDHIRLTHGNAEVTGTAAFSPSTQGFRLNLTGKNFDLSRVRQLQLEELPIDGRADFTLEGSGTFRAPEINAAIQVRDLTLDRELWGGLNIDATSKAGELHLTAHSDFGKGTLAIDGTVGLHGDFPANLTAKLDHDDLDAFWRAYLGQQLTGHSAVAGSVTLDGPLRYPKQWKMSGILTDLAIEVEYTKLRTQGPLRFAYFDQTIHIERTRLVGEGTDIVGQGSIQLAAPKALDLVADGTADLKLASRLDSDLTASGVMAVHITVGGTWWDPRPQGTIAIKNAAVNYAGLPSGLSDANGSLTFTRDRIRIEHLSAHTGGGTLDFRGDATNYNQQVNFNLTVIAKDVRLRYPAGVSSTASAELHWIGTRNSSTVSGDVLVTKLAVTPGFDFGSYLERSRQSGAITAANSPLYNIKLDVAVRTSPELQMQTAVARLSGDADLKLRGSVARPSVLGRVDILEGDATFNGIKFRLERGDITFANPVAIDPQFNLQATTHVRNYDLDVTVTGTPERLNVTYRSEPPLPKSDIIALLALGRTSGESEQLQQQSGQTLFTDEATNLIINQAINSTVSNRMQKLFGVSRIKIDPQGLTTETNPTARGPQITIQQEFANNLSLTYSTNVSQSAQQIIEGEYFFTRNFSVVGTRDQNGVVSFDVRVRRRRK